MFRVKNQVEDSLWRKSSRRFAVAKVKSRLVANSLLPAPCSPPRRGISLTEVLISMGILTLGLLGVMAMFPVGSYYMLRADIADNGSAIAQGVMNDIAARGMLDPKAWQMLVTTPTFTSSPPAPTDPDKAPENFFARSVGRAMAADPNQSPLHLAQQYGSAFVIDPMSIAVIASATSTGYNKLPAPFPAEAGTYDLSYYSNVAWKSWDDGTGRSELWPIRRVTFHQPDPSDPANPIRLTDRVAESLFSTTDDLAFDLPSRDDRPAVQMWDTTSAGAPLERQSVGEYSWIVTVAPTSSEAQVALGRNPQSHAYDVSVVVFYKRAIPRTLDPYNAYVDLVSQEAVVGGSVVSQGPNGGEMLLRLIGSYTSDSPIDKLRAGQWLMLCGPHPTSTYAAPRFVMNWYQIMAIDKEAVGIINDPDNERVVALRGPEWPWQPAPGGLSSSHLSNDLCVGIIPGAVAVHTKTMRLEGPRTSVWGGGVSGAAAASDPGGLIGY